MVCKRILTLALMTVCLCVAIGCGSDKPAATQIQSATESRADENPSLTTVTLSGGSTEMSLDLPFDVPAPPKDESANIPPDLQNIIMQSCSYEARNEQIILNVFSAPRSTRM